METGKRYRPDIDGLRALAVMPVLLFHAKLACPGGFVGVDVFFVISGYLISTMILNELHEGRFSLVGFWERRIRRILPALLVVVLSVLVAGWFVYLPRDFETLGKSVAAQAALVSNIFFYLQPEGYFAAGFETKPLLHTWSLAVEEQFYLFFPLLLLLLMRYTRITLFKTLAFLAILSFAWSVIGTYTNPSAAFFLLPSRAWELLIGTLLAITAGRLPLRPWIRQSAGWFGLALLIFAIFFFSEATRFPGFAAVPPCLGTALIICSSEYRLSHVGRILSWRPAVFVGLISYSLYLWHWPLLVYSQYLLGYQKWPLRIALLTASFALAVLTWKYVETPFRRRRLLPQRSRLFSAAGVSLAAMIVLGLFVRFENGIPSRFSEKALEFANGSSEASFRKGTTLEEAFAGQFVELGSPESTGPISVLVWGDSHAMGITQAIDDLCRRFSLRGVQAAHHGLPPILDTSASPLAAESTAFARAVIAYVKEHQVKNVVITAHWNQYAKSAVFGEDLLATVKAVMHAGARVFVMKDVPDQGYDVPRITALTERYGGEIEKLGVSPQSHLAANNALAKYFNQLAQMGVPVLDPADYFLNSRGLYAGVKAGHVLYTDGNHLSIQGARFLEPLFEPIFIRQ